jgi:hypothetical protein
MAISGEAPTTALINHDVDKELSPCVKSILCGLNAAAKDALIAFLDLYIAQGRTQVNVYKAQLLQFDIAVIPVQIARGIADQVIAEIKKYTQVLPLGLFQGCSDLGDLNQAATAFIDEYAAEANIILDDLERLLSFKLYLEATIRALEELLKYLTSLLDIFEGCDSK